MFRPSVIRALLTRYVLLYAKNPMRAFELFFWPLVQLLVWGFVTMYLQQAGGGGQAAGEGGKAFPNYITFLIGGIILWDALFRAQQGVSISFLEDVWTRNLLNIFAAPVRMTDYIAATFGVGLLRVAITAIVLIVVASVAYSFNLLQFKIGLIAYYANLMIFGWALGILSIALILRWGHGAESLAWALPFMIQPFACVFYPMSVLPGWMQAIASAFPPAHVFEGMRGAIEHGGFDMRQFLIALGLNAVYLGLSGWAFAAVLRTAREKGLLVKTSSS
ncbi:ABC transporter permease [Luteolibacter flavescens]|uniref:Transport permease protein n=1 Tax=Luteolibacter flavescens TaxID=1859460 RepID=A0ABT3FIU4_9BACT|nr:ABC transporter permease [Luteolibacter flavescens]MCW1883488.1 ABC transporter permease [Luteolibacter flavescens]